MAKQQHTGHPGLKVSIRKVYADLKLLLIDLESRYRETGRKQPSGVQRERLSEEDPKGYAIVQRTVGM